MGRMYSVTSSAAALVTAGDVMEINAPTDAVVILHRVFFGQDTDYGDAQAEILRIQLNRATTGGSGGGTPTANPLSAGDSAFGGTCESFNTTDATTLTTLIDEAFNVQAGWLYDPTPEERIEISPGERIVLFLEKAPSSAFDAVVTMIFEAVGG